MKFPEQAAEIRRLMKDSELSREKMAERAGMSPETLRVYENGYQQASSRLIQTLRNVAQWEQERRHARAMQDESLPAELREAAAEYGHKITRLPPAQQKTVRDLVDHLTAAAVDEVLPDTTAEYPPYGKAASPGDTAAAPPLHTPRRKALPPPPQARLPKRRASGQ